MFFQKYTSVKWKKIPLVLEDILISLKTGLEFSTKTSVFLSIVKKDGLAIFDIWSSLSWLESSLDDSIVIRFLFVIVLLFSRLSSLNESKLVVLSINGFWIADRFWEVPPIWWLSNPSLVFGIVIVVPVTITSTRNWILLRNHK